MTDWDVSKLINIQNRKSKIENDTVKLVNRIENLLENAAKAKIPCLKFQGAVWTSPFDTIMKTFEGSPEELLERDDLMVKMLDFDVILCLQDEESVRKAWNEGTDKNIEPISSTGSFHGDTPTMKLEEARNDQGDGKKKLME